MKDFLVYKIITNTISIFKEKINIGIFSIAFLFFLGLFAFFYGLITIPMPGGAWGFYRMVPPTSFEMFYMIFSVVVSALIITITIHSVKTKMKDGF